MLFTKLKRGNQNVGQPRFNSRTYFYTQEYSQPKTSFSMDGDTLRLSSGKSPKDWVSIAVPGHSWSILGTPKSLKLGFDELSKDWFLCMSHEVKEAEECESGHVVLFDPGCKTALTGIKTDGTFWEYDFYPLKNTNMSAYTLIDELRSKLDQMKGK